MNSWFKDYFTLSRGEQRGYLLLCLGILLVAGLRYYWHNSRPLPHQDIDTFNQLISKLDSFSLDKNDSLSNTIKRSGSSLRSKKETADFQQIEKFPFDPNTVTYKELRTLGFNTLAASSIVKWRSKKPFENPSEINQVYGVNDSFFNCIKDFILLEEISTKTFQNEPTVIKSIIDLNACDSIELKRLTGIGPVLSKRIISYRTVLGGFYSLDQLSEVYGLEDSVIRKNRSYIKINSSPEKRNINLLKVEDLKAHPYISFKQARSIVRYREEHGNFSTLEDLSNIYLIDGELKDKLNYYFTVN